MRTVSIVERTYQVHATVWPHSSRSRKNKRKFGFVPPESQFASLSKSSVDRTTVSLTFDVSTSCDVTSQLPLRPLRRSSEGLSYTRPLGSSVSETSVPQSYEHLVGTLEYRYPVQVLCRVHATNGKKNTSQQHLAAFDHHHGIHHRRFPFLPNSGTRQMDQ